MTVESGTSSFLVSRVGCVLCLVVTFDWLLALANVLEAERDEHGDASSYDWQAVRHDARAEIRTRRAVAAISGK